MNLIEKTLREQKEQQARELADNTARAIQLLDSSPLYAKSLRFAEIAHPVIVDASTFAGTYLTVQGFSRSFGSTGISQQIARYVFWPNQAESVAPNSINYVFTINVGAMGINFINFDVSVTPLMINAKNEEDLHTYRFPDMRSERDHGRQQWLANVMLAILQRNGFV